MSKKIILLSLMGSLLLFGAGCISFSQGGISTGGGVSSGADGGFFKSTDRGDNWTQKVTLPSADGTKQSIAGVNVVAIAQDPQDPNALYLGSVENGLFYSYDGGESWQRPAQIASGRVSSIAVHPKDKCVVYATSGNRLLKTEDCSRTWNITYLDARPDRLVSAVLIDFANPNIVWVTTDGGDVLKSTDAGQSWVSKNTFRSAVLKTKMIASDSRRLYVATSYDGLWRTDDGGDHWKDLSETYMSSFPDSANFSDMAVGTADPGTIIMANGYGLLRSRDFGETWEALDLLTPPRSTNIYSIALDPKDSMVIYYGTATTFYRSPNGGVNWVPKKLPTSRAATVLRVDNSNSSLLYMGVTKLK